jgi:dCMP deaminase
MVPGTSIPVPGRVLVVQFIDTVIKFLFKIHSFMKGLGLFSPLLHTLKMYSASAPLGLTPPSQWYLSPSNVLTLPDIQRYGWNYDSSTRSIDQNYMDLAYRIARNSYCVEGNMGSVFVRGIPVGSGGVVVGGGESGGDGVSGDDKVGEESNAQSQGEIIAETVNTALVQRFHSECHAEANAVSACCRLGISLEGASCYVTRAPCTHCYRLLVTAGVTRIVCPHVPASDDCAASVRDLKIDWVVMRSTQEEMRARDQEASAHENSERTQLLRQERKAARVVQKQQSKQRKKERAVERAKVEASQKKKKRDQETDLIAGLPT